MRGRYCVLPPGVVTWEEDTYLRAEGAMVSAINDLSDVLGGLARVAHKGAGELQNLGCLMRMVKRKNRPLA